MKTQTLSMQELIGKGYKEYWSFTGDEVIMMGSKASKKSKTVALRWAKLLKQYPKACLLCLRQNANTLRDSCYADMIWAMKKLYLYDEWDFITNPLQATNKHTKQKIYFRGLDDFQKIASITTDDPELYLCWGWFEEAFELSEEDYTQIRMSLRGLLPDGYFMQTVASFNPWLNSHWLVKRLTDKLIPQESILQEKGKQVIELNVKEKIIYNGTEQEIDTKQLLLITNYLLNEFLDPQDLGRYEKLKRENPKRFKTIGLGMPGVAEGLVYADVFDNNNVLNYKEAKELKYIDYVGGIDYGQVESATAGIFVGIQGIYDKIVLFDEYYHTNKDTIKPKEIDEYVRDLVIFFSLKLIEFNIQRRLFIYVDNANVGFIQLLNQEALKQKQFLLKFLPCFKMQVQDRQDITKGLMAQKKWLCTDRCVNYAREVVNCEYEEGKQVRVKDPAHLIDSSEYATTPYYNKILKRGE